MNLAYALRRGADAVAKELVCAQCITDYFVYVLRSVRQRWAQAENHSMLNKGFPC